MTVYPIRLINGPYDGDRGEIVRLVDRIWVAECNDRHCPAGGLHWFTQFDAVPRQLRSVAYDLDEETGVDREGAHPYVYASPNTGADVNSASERELLKA